LKRVAKRKRREQEVDKLKEQSLQVQERVKQNLKEERDLPAIDQNRIDIELKLKRE